MRIIIFGPQGSGKGTQAELVARRHYVPYISTGDIFRYHLKNQTELGKKVAAYLNSGRLAPDELTNEVVKDRIHQPDCAVGFVLDGFPRNRFQKNFIDTLTTVDAVIVIELSDEEAITRLGGRLACKCGLSYHTAFNPPKKTGVCDRCGDVLFRRDDDQPEAIKQRLEIYHRETEPLFNDYEKEGILRRVDGAQPIDSVYQQIETIIAKLT